MRGGKSRPVFRSRRASCDLERKLNYPFGEFQNPFLIELSHLIRFSKSSFNSLRAKIFLARDFFRQRSIIETRPQEHNILHRKKLSRFEVYFLAINFRAFTFVVRDIIADLWRTKRSKFLIIFRFIQPADFCYVTRIQLNPRCMLSVAILPSKSSLPRR